MRRFYKIAFSLNEIGGGREKYLETAKFEIVLKACGQRYGKGVLICNTLEEAKRALRRSCSTKKFGSAGNEMVIEEFMTGREVSDDNLSFVDGRTIKTMSSAQDHKRAGDGVWGLAAAWKLLSEPVLHKRNG